MKTATKVTAVRLRSLVRDAVVLGLGLISLAIAVYLVSAPAHAADCISDWSKAAPIVRDQKLPSLEDVIAKDKRLKGKRVVKAMLCQNPSGFSYNFVVQSNSGELRKLTVDVGQLRLACWAHRSKRSERSFDLVSGQLAKGNGLYYRSAGPNAGVDEARGHCEFSLLKTIWISIGSS